MARNRSNKSARSQIQRQARNLMPDSSRDYWRIAGGLAGLAVTAFVLLTMLGGRRGITEKARSLLDWESEGHHVPGSDIGEQGGDADSLRAH